MTSWTTPTPSEHPAPPATREVGGEGQEEQAIRLGSWIGNQRSRAATLSPERVELLSAIGMRWA
ncbi:MULTISPECIES: helicase associated domain-containing protein [unclassified Streptomyces]|uniref:helicase associated domain-containing protein n=1 Tax=unclassified Streptomyces TaxID=2593676 RepID=UPI002B1CCFD2|nr:MULTISPECIES: helicase associated domain-containing protein [unclassified Streptomyces]